MNEFCGAESVVFNSLPSATTVTEPVMSPIQDAMFSIVVIPWLNRYALRMLLEAVKVNFKGIETRTQIRKLVFALVVRNCCERCLACLCRT